MVCRLVGAKPLPEPIVNWTLSKKLQSNLKWNSHIFIQENAFESVVSKMAAILSHPQWVDKHCTKPSHYLNQCWLIVNWTPGNKFQWNLNRNPIIFIKENAFENVVCQNGGHFVRGRWVKKKSLTHIYFDCCMLIYGWVGARKMKLHCKHTGVMTFLH